MLVSGGRAGLTTLWNPVQDVQSDENGAHVAVRAHRRAGVERRHPAPPPRRGRGAEPHERGVYGHSIEFTADGRTLVSAEPTRVRVFDLALQQRASHISDGTVTAIATARTQPDRLRRRRRPGPRLDRRHVRRAALVAAAVVDRGLAGAGRRRRARARRARRRRSDRQRRAALQRRRPAVARRAGPDRARRARHRLSPSAPTAGSWRRARRTRRSRLWSRRTGAADRHAVGADASSPRSRSRPTAARSPAPRPAARSACGTSRRAARSARRCPPAGPTDLAFAPDNRDAGRGRHAARAVVRPAVGAHAGRDRRPRLRRGRRDRSRTAEWRAAVTDRSWRATCE